MADKVLWLTEEDVVASITLNDAIDALAAALRLEGEGEARNVDKSFGTWGTRSAMHVLGSMMPGRGYIGFKTWANTPGGASSIFSLFGAEDGQLLALIEAGALGQMRTSGISGLATRALADPAADEMALIGTGAQSFMQVAAVAATRKLRRLRVFSPSADKRAAFVARARDAFAFDVVETESVAEAVAGVPIVTLITRAAEPFLFADMLADGVHINAAGAILPGAAEFGQDVFDRASLVVVDSIPNARKGARELIDRYGVDDAGWTEVRTLGAVLAQGAQRPAGNVITLFKPMGMGLSDLSVAVTVYERASIAGHGQWVQRGKPTPARWQALS